MKRSIISLLALSTIGLLTLPALADDATIQRSDQVSTQEGNRNTAIQDSSQSNINRGRNRRGEDTGTVQESYQDTLQQGSDNVSVQESDQRNVRDTRRR
ncbi:hypothetical protein [Crocosphaera subtropica]|nr:hypothetical protein [Crocosphaera subtropica]